MQSFVYNGQSARVIFGSGRLAQLPAEVDRLGLKRVLVLATPPQAEVGNDPLRFDELIRKIREAESKLRDRGSKD